jgi:hypothetical protein
MDESTQTDPNQEIAAIGAVYDALKGLDATVQGRVLEYVAKMLGIGNVASYREPLRETREDEQPQSPSLPPPAAGSEVESESEGISPVALKWMRRSGLTSTGLSLLFSLGVDEIDLVAKKVPGETKKDRMHSVLLLKGIAAYLGSGVARVTHEQLKEACGHYDAYDAANFATHLKSFAAEASGTRSAGYTLTARGITNATEMIKSLVTAA